LSGYDLEESVELGSINREARLVLVHEHGDLLGITEFVGDADLGRDPLLAAGAGVWPARRSATIGDQLRTVRLPRGFVCTI